MEDSRLGFFGKWILKVSRQEVIKGVLLGSTPVEEKGRNRREKREKSKLWCQNKGFY